MPRRARQRAALRSSNALGWALGWALAAMLGGCTGPSLTIESRDPTFVDGRRVGKGDAPSTTLPFRYYGTTLVDTLPRDQDGAADFQRLPTRAAVLVDEPVTPWIYPLDFFGEVILGVTGSRGDQHFVPAETAARPAGEPTDAELKRLTQRALDARLER